jgi:hypothetical protein
MVTAVISSTILDLPDHRREVHDACLRQQIFPIMMEHLAAQNAAAQQASLALVDRADLYIGVFGFRYGFCPPAGPKSITELEYERAVARNLPRFLFLMDEKRHPIFYSDVEQGEGAEKLRVFKDTLRLDRVCGLFGSPMELRSQVIETLSTWRIETLTGGRLS